MRQRLNDYRVFWREFRQAYQTTGAVFPSGSALSHALSRFVRDENTANGADASATGGRRILEVGPGTGAVTMKIAKAMRPNDQLTLVERNEKFVGHLQARLDDDSFLKSIADRTTLLHASIEDLPEEAKYDLIISGLPLNNFPVDLVEQILAKLQGVLTPGGTLSFFEYVAIRRAKSLVSAAETRQRLRGISRIFEELLRKREIRRDLVLANFPPAWVHHLRFTNPN
jgi:phosphatidylethanolamine/phosphatidyl-N-methylethanolamine N-methyltransferase